MKCLKQINNKNNLFGLFNYLNKFFATEGKVKTNDSSAKAKQFTIDSFFVDDNNDLIKNHLDSNSYESNQFKNDINIEQYNSIDKEKDISNLNDIHLPPNEKSKENLYNTGKVSIPRMSYGTQSSKQDEIINELLNNKSNNYYPINNSQLKNTNNSATPLTKRNKMNFVRDGMILGFYLKKSSNRFVSGKIDGYLFIDLKEYNYELNVDKIKEKDPRSIVLNPIICAKLLLIDPKSYNEKELQKITISQKNKQLEIEQDHDKKFKLTIIVKNNNEDLIEVPIEKSNMIISSIELNPEDIIIIQKFVNVKDLLNRFV